MLDLEVQTALEKVRRRRDKERVKGQEGEGKGEVDRDRRVRGKRKEGKDGRRTENQFIQREGSMLQVVDN
jgi:hypothetical protein